MTLRWKDGFLVLESEPAPTVKAWRAAVHASHVLERVEARLVAAGALTELRQLQGLSASEQDVLIHREIHEPVTTPVPEGSQGLPPGCPQTTHATVAA